MTLGAILIALGTILLIAGIKGLAVWDLVLGKPTPKPSGSLLQ